MNDALVEALKEACLREPRFTVAVAESLTCGQLQAAIGAVSGVSAFFPGGLTAYATAQKVRHLGVDPAEAGPTEGVSAEVARQMAVGAIRFFGADFAAATTGYAEPNPSRGFDAPTAFFAVARAHPGGGETRAGVVREGRIDRPGASRGAMQAAVVTAVLQALLEAVLDARK